MFVSDTAIAAAVEMTTLAECEAMITRGLQGYREIGRALQTIREAKLYREAGHGDFDTYCRARWQMSRRQADRAIEAARVASNLEDRGVEPPACEAHARALASLEPEMQADAWIDLVQEAAGGKITTNEVRETVAICGGAPLKPPRAGTRKVRQNVSK
jgi:hypothetical protein